MKYAVWEENQGDLPRARSVFERALDVNYRSPTLWMRYAEMEMKARNVNTARNVWDRAVSLLPRVDTLWYKYIHMEELLGAVASARQLFERWMGWEPDHAGWGAYIKLELRYGETERARAVFERYVQCHPGPRSWLKYAKFEAAVAGDRPRCRRVYERAAQQLEGEPGCEEVLLGFASFEAFCRETERARAIYTYALAALPPACAPAVLAAHAAFEKQHGGASQVEGVVLAQRRAGYEARLAASPFDYDAWFDLLRCLEEGGDAGAVRSGYARAAAAAAPPPEAGDPKRPWRRYIYVWLHHAAWEEAEAGDVGRARAVLAAALRAVPHASFTFAKLWIAAAQLELRAGALGAARALLGSAIGRCPKAKLFRFYIDAELQLGCVDRARKLYAKLLEWRPEAAGAWARFAALERSLGETERAAALFALGLQQPELDAPEVLWKAAIDAAVADGERPAARALYTQLLARTQHVRVWLSFAAFEAAPLPGAGEGAGAGGEEAPAQRAARARAVYARADAALRLAPDDKEPRVMLLEAWRAAEEAAGDGDAARAVDARMPRRVKRRRALHTEDGEPAGVEGEGKAGGQTVCHPLTVRRQNTTTFCFPRRPLRAGRTSKSWRRPGSGRKHRSLLQPPKERREERKEKGRRREKREKKERGNRDTSYVFLMPGSLSTKRTQGKRIPYSSVQM